jgi:hypothetical protein
MPCLLNITSPCRPIPQPRITYLLTYLLTYLPTYLLTPQSRVLLEELTGFQLVKELPAFYETRRFIIVFTSARHLCLSSVSSVQSLPPHPTSWRSILILSSHLRLGHPIRFPHQNPVYASPLPHTRYIPHPSYYPLFYQTRNATDIFIVHNPRYKSIFLKIQVSLITCRLLK